MLSRVVLPIDYRAKASLDPLGLKPFVSEQNVGMSTSDLSRHAHLGANADGIAILIDNDGRPKGVATAETLRAGGAGYVPATTVSAASVIEDALTLAKETSCPFCVVDADGLLLGAASQSTILEAIARPGGKEYRR